MNMATDVIAIIMDALEAVFTGIGTSLTVLWSSLIYDATTGLTVFAEWFLVFLGFTFGMSILFMVLKKVL